MLTQFHDHVASAARHISSHLVAGPINLHLALAGVRLLYSAYHDGGRKLFEGLERILRLRKNWQAKDQHKHSVFEFPVDRHSGSVLKRAFVLT
jgi:hypothetical protein